MVFQCGLPNSWFAYRLSWPIWKIHGNHVSPTSLNILSSYAPCVLFPSPFSFLRLTASLTFTRHLIKKIWVLRPNYLLESYWPASPYWEFLEAYVLCGTTWGKLDHREFSVKYVTVPYFILKLSNNIQNARESNNFSQPPWSHQDHSLSLCFICEEIKAEKIHTFSETFKLSSQSTKICSANY